MQLSAASKCVQPVVVGNGHCAVPDWLKAVAVYKLLVFGSSWSCQQPVQAAEVPVVSGHTRIEVAQSFQPELGVGSHKIVALPLE